MNIRTSFQVFFSQIGGTLISRSLVLHLAGNRFFFFFLSFVLFSLAALLALLISLADVLLHVTQKLISAKTIKQDVEVAKTHREENRGGWNERFKLSKFKIRTFLN